MPQEEERNIIIVDSSSEAALELVRQLMPLLLDVPRMAELVKRITDKYDIDAAELYAAGAYSLAALILSGRVTIGVDEISKPF